MSGMDDETVKHLWALREVNKALIAGLEMAVFLFDKWEDLTPERRKSMVEKLQGLIAQSNEVYGEKSETH